MYAFIYLSKKSICFSQNLEIAQELKLYFRHVWRPCEDYFSYLLMSSTLSIAFVLNTCLFWRIGCELARLTEISLSSDFLLKEQLYAWIEFACFPFFVLIVLCVGGFVGVCVCVQGWECMGVFSCLCVCFRNIHRTCFSSFRFCSFTLRAGPRNPR